MSGRKSKANVNPVTVKIAQAGLFTAIIFVFTMFVKVPTGIGYAHVGDAFIYLYACMGGGWYALVAGSIGATIADLVGGYAIYAPATLIIKPLVALPFVLICKNEPKILNLKSGLTNILALVIDTVGYFFANWIIFGQSASTGGKTALASAASATVGTALQGVASTVVFIIVALALDKVNMKQRMLYYTGKENTYKKAKKKAA